MTQVKPPPIYQPLFDDQQNPIAALQWILFFNQIYNGDTGTEWTPTFTSLTTVGTPTFTGKYYQLSKSLVYYNITITPSSGGSTTATAGTTYVSNFPLKSFGNGACIAVAGLTGGSTPGMFDAATNRIYVPSWSAVTVPLTIVGIVEAT